MKHVQGLMQLAWDAWAVTQSACCTQTRTVTHVLARKNHMLPTLLYIISPRLDRSHTTMMTAAKPKERHQEKLHRLVVLQHLLRVQSTSVNFLAACLYFLACRHANPPAALSLPATTGSFCRHQTEIRTRCQIPEVMASWPQELSIWNTTEKSQSLGLSASCPRS